MPELPGAGMPGPFAVHVEGFRQALAGSGYSPRTVRDHGYVLAQLSRWLVAEHLSPEQLTEPVLHRFVQARRLKGYRRWRSRRSLRLMVSYLRAEGAIPVAGPAEPDDPLRMLLDGYRRYLVAERRLAPCTVRARVDVAREFLAPRVTGAGLDVESLAAADVTGFLAAQARLRTTTSLKAMASPLRCLLRYLFVAGVASRDLSGAVPAVASPRLAPLPAGVAPAVVAALLASCDRTCAVGRRDLAILVLMVRLGLRAGEVAALRLDDIDWRAGTVVIRGKGGRIDQLPLPSEAGEAVADYLRHGRPASRCRAVFLRSCGPEGAMTGDVALGAGANLRCHGKGRKQRCTPLTRATARILADWLRERDSQPADPPFPARTGGRLSTDAVADLLARHATSAARQCPTLSRKKITPHTLRHTAAMNLLHAGVDTSTIALWLGHAGTNATQVYLHADLALKEAALARTAPPDAGVSATGRLTTCSPSSKACNHAHRYAGPIATLTPPGLRQHPPPPASPA